MTDADKKIESPLIRVFLWVFVILGGVLCLGGLVVAAKFLLSVFHFLTYQAGVKLW